MKKYLTLLILIFTLNIFAANNQKWTPLKFIKKGTKRLIKQGQRKYYFYRSEKDDFLSIEISRQKIIKVEIIEKKEGKPVSFTIAIDNIAKNYTIAPKKQVGKYWIFEPIKLNLNPGKHLIRINTNNRNAYFRIFRESKKKISTKSYKASKSKNVVFIKNISSEKRITFFGGNKKIPVIYTLNGINGEIIGYAKSLLNPNNEVKFNILIDGKKVKTISIPQKISKKYSLHKQPLSRGKKFTISLSSGKHVLTFQPISDTEIFFRLNK